MYPLAASNFYFAFMNLYEKKRKKRTFPWVSYMYILFSMTTKSESKMLGLISQEKLQNGLKYIYIFFLISLGEAVSSVEYRTKACI